MAQLFVSRAARRAREGLRILVVEDDPMFRKLLEGWFEQGDEPDQVTFCTDLAQALEAMEELPHDLVLLDLNLPDSRGMATLRAVRQQEANGPVVVLTGEEDEDLGLQAVRSGAQDFLRKGDVGPHVLKRQLRFAFERRRLQELQARAMEHELELKRLRELDRARASFYQAAARGLRDPLNPLRLGLQVLRVEVQGRQSPAYREALNGLEQHLGHLDKLVQDLVDFAAIQNGTLELERRPLDLATLARDAVARWAPRAREDRLALDGTIDEDLPLDGDDQRLRDVLDHLLDNAVGATPGGGRVLVLAYRDGGQAVLQVQDSGIGVDPEEIPRIFEAFGSEGEDGSRGLGMAFCKGVAEAHGGSLLLESDGQGKGATVTLRLPLAGELD